MPLCVSLLTRICFGSARGRRPMSIYINRVYTRSGDEGTTGLIGGERVSKASLQLECYGTCDELISFVGLVRTQAETAKSSDLKGCADRVFKKIQNELFDIGSQLAVPLHPSEADKPKFASMPRISSEKVDFLEKECDRMTESLPPLKSFVLPGGSVLNGHTHVARTVCRRLERLLVRLHSETPIDPVLRAYVNRLSDFLFVFARWSAKEEGIAEYLWEKGLGK
ncbi:MAG: cob(I)yrinic acid a,c-diamide adenosyltransferase [Spirochaetia bacterium]|nr:cob(I)yrinic acid a,c-diamide adenosyltransferase [Spirochaetia bacterium]